MTNFLHEVHLQEVAVKILGCGQVCDAQVEVSNSGMGYGVCWSCIFIRYHPGLRSIFTIVSI